MSRLRLYQLAVVAGFILLLEALCLAGVIDKIIKDPIGFLGNLTSAIASRAS